MKDRLAQLLTLARTRYPDLSIRNSAHQQLGHCASDEFPTPETVRGMGFRRTDF